MARQGVINMAAEIGGGGFVTPRSVTIAEQGMRRVLGHIGLLLGPTRPPQLTRLA